ncbi:hypothetical protein RRF57_007970 [Xylaria bambusicola]|uniref:Uncharacterized protein n=1 Tax=Xylaria bambusicola TaxID=326684 RepID=A0AAN7ZAQ9_9PEZI
MGTELPHRSCPYFPITLNGRDRRNIVDRSLVRRRLRRLSVTFMTINNQNTSTMIWLTGFSIEEFVGGEC